jgi:hypothetical protein
MEFSWQEFEQAISGPLIREALFDAKQILSDLVTPRPLVPCWVPVNSDWKPSLTDWEEAYGS